MSEFLSTCPHCMGEGTTYVVPGGYSQLNTGQSNNLIECPYCLVFEINTIDVEKELKNEIKKRGRKSKK